MERGVSALRIRKIVLSVLRKKVAGRRYCLVDPGDEVQVLNEELRDGVDPHSSSHGEEGGLLEEHTAIAPSDCIHSACGNASPFDGLLFRPTSQVNPLGLLAEGEVDLTPVIGSYGVV
eukprot:471860-Amorphochlora_amoeboformis.AAC.1